MNMMLSAPLRSAFISSMFFSSICALAMLGARGAAAEEGLATNVPLLPEPQCSVEVAEALVEALGGSRTFSLPDLDTRSPVPANQSLVWSGSSVNGETSIGVFSLRLQPESLAARGGGGPTELEFTIEPEAILVRATHPVQREYLGGFRFARAANFVRRIATRLEGKRELALFAPAMEEGEQGFGLAFCLTTIGSKDIGVPQKSEKIVDYPSREPFVLESARFVPRGFIEGRIRSGILPSEARASIAHSATIGRSIEALDETLSQDPAVGVTYAPVAPPQFVPVARPDRVGAVMRAEVQLATPAGHRQTQTLESEVWVERLSKPLSTSGGGLEMMPKELLPTDVVAEGPIYGSCFIVGGRHARSSAYADPKPEAQRENQDPQRSVSTAGESSPKR